MKKSSLRNRRIELVRVVGGFPSEPFVISGLLLLGALCMWMGSR